MEKDLNYCVSEVADSINQTRSFGMLIHFSTLLSLLFPFAGIIVACILWLYKRQQSVLIYECGRHALNFQLSTFFYTFLCLVFVAIALFLNSSFLKIIVILSCLIILSLYFYWFIFTFVAGFKAVKGQAYRIPLTLPFIKAEK